MKQMKVEVNKYKWRRVKKTLKKDKAMLNNKLKVEVGD